MKDKKKQQKATTQFIKILATKWTTRVILCLASGPKRLSQLRNDIPEASKKMIVESLHRLVDRRFVAREDLSAKFQHVEYSLTLDGRSLLELVRYLAIMDAELEKRAAEGG